MKPIPIFLCSLLIPIAVRAESPKNSGGPPRATLSLTSVTESVLANNPSIKEARGRWEAMKQRVPQAAAWEDLKVSGTTRLGRFVDVARNSFTDQMLSVEQSIPISGKNRSRERIATAESAGGLEELRRKELDLVAKARAAFFRLAKDYALQDLNRSKHASLAQSLEISRARLEVGDQGQAGVQAAEAELVRIDEAGRDVDRAISEDETQLKVLMNRDPFSPLGKPIASSAHPALPSIGRLRGWILSNRPEVRMAEAGIAAAKAKLELAKREWIPDPALSVEAQRYNGASQVASEVGVGISFNVPWLSGKKYRAGEREAQSGLEAAQRSLESAQTEALGLLRDQLQKIETFHHHIDLFDARLLPLARQAVETNRTNYESGKASFLELITSVRELREAEAMYQQHLADYETAVAELEAVIGGQLNLFSAHQETLKRRSR